MGSVGLCWAWMGWVVMGWDGLLLMALAQSDVGVIASALHAAVTTQIRPRERIHGIMGHEGVATQMTS